MRRIRPLFIVIVVGALILFAENLSAQQMGAGANASHGGSAQGTLTVTLTVVASVGVIIGPDGEQKLIIANAADPADKIAYLQPLATPAPPAPTRVQLAGAPASLRPKKVSKAR